MRARPSWTRPRVRRPSRRLLREQALVVGLAALIVAALVVGHEFGSIHSPLVSKRLLAWLLAACVLVLGVFFTRRVASLLGRASDRSSITSASVTTGMRLVVSIVGYLLVIALVLSLLDVSVGRLLLGSALAGVILAVAAQQSLGNAFAGVVLLFARPFAVGDHIRIRSGSLGGVFDGVVRGMSLTYVTLDTAEGRLMIPNAALLEAAIGPYRPAPEEHGVTPPGGVPAAAPPPDDQL